MRINQWKLSVWVAALCLTGPITAQAQEDIGAICRPALMKDVLSYMSTDQQKYSYFSQVDEKTFEQLKIDANAGASIPLLGDMVDVIKASASYSQFVEKRREYFSRVGYTRDSAREVRDVRIVTSPVAYQAWTSCVMALAAQRGSLVVYKDHEDEDTVHVLIRNNTPVRVKLWSDLINASVPGQEPGKAFGDATQVSAGGVRPVLLRRSGTGGMRLSVRSDPPFEGLFVESEWGASPSAHLTGTLTTSFEVSRIEERGERRGDTWTTPELHEEDCERDPCTGDRRWQLARNTLWVRAAAGRKLRAPRVRCDVDNQGACGWSNEAGHAQCVVEAGETRAACTVLSGSRSHRIVILADEYEVVVNPAPSVTEPFLVFEGGQFQLRVPTNARTAHFDYRTPRGASGFTPGAQSSPDGTVVLLGHEDKPDARYFTYRLQ